MRTRLMALLVLGGLAFSLPAGAQNDPDWTRPFPPFRIIGNVYWVGSYDLSTYLITTPQGNILINTGVGDTAQQRKKSVQDIWFTITDTKILTQTPGHFDHRPGRLGLTRHTGARVLIADPHNVLPAPRGRDRLRDPARRHLSSNRSPHRGAR